MSNSTVFYENRKNRVAYQQVINKKKVLTTPSVEKKYHVLRKQFFFE